MTQTISKCDICHRTEADVRLESWEMDGVTFTVCVDTPSCDAVAWNTEHHPQPPPVDQLLRQRGYAELPGMPS